MCRGRPSELRVGGRWCAHDRVEPLTPGARVEVELLPSATFFLPGRRCASTEAEEHLSPPDELRGDASASLVSRSSASKKRTTCPLTRHQDVAEAVIELEHDRDLADVTHLNHQRPAATHIRTPAQLDSATSPRHHRDTDGSPERHSPSV